VAGVRLNNNTVKTTQSKRRFLDSKVTVAGVELNNNSAITTQSKRWSEWRQNLSNFREKQYENEEQFAAKWRKLWLEWNSTTTQQARKPERNQQQGRKIWGPSWNVCSQWHVRVVTWRVAAWLFNVGITSCRRIKLRHFNNARPFWNKCVFTSR
jgi:hypothetical protein